MLANYDFEVVGEAEKWSNGYSKNNKELTTRYRLQWIIIYARNGWN